MGKKKLNTQERKEFREYISIQDKNILDTKKYDIELISNDEVFVLVKNTYSYWISNHGRLINNRTSKIHYHKTISTNGHSIHFTLTGYDIDKQPMKIDTYLHRLVAEHFLICPINHNNVWHIDGDINNNYYKNLIYVNDLEYNNLQNGNIKLDDLDIKQEYLSYTTIDNKTPYSIWDGICVRCYKTTEKRLGECYQESTMCDGWLDDRDSFAEWYMSNYYECDGESMAVDKDLLVRGNKVYSPDTCCILPQTLNTMLSNCKKHKVGKMFVKRNDYPLGVNYNREMEKYYGKIKPYGYNQSISLSYWDTPEEAFADYKRFKQADILLMAAKYKDKIPQKVYKALLEYEVEPY